MPILEDQLDVIKQSLSKKERFHRVERQEQVRMYLLCLSPNAWSLLNKSADIHTFNRCSTSTFNVPFYVETFQQKFARNTVMTHKWHTQYGCKWKVRLVCNVVCLWPIECKKHTGRTHWYISSTVVPVTRIAQKKTVEAHRLSVGKKKCSRRKSEIFSFAKPWILVKGVLSISHNPGSNMLKRGERERGRFKYMYIILWNSVNTYPKENEKEYVLNKVRSIRGEIYPKCDVRRWESKRYNRVYVLTRVRTNRVSL